LNITGFREASSRRKPGSAIPTAIRLPHIADFSQNLARKEEHVFEEFPLYVAVSLDKVADSR
jgi:hypothetical protein